MLGSPTISALPITLATVTRRAGAVAVAAGAGDADGAPDSRDSSESRRAAPSSGVILPVATWSTISRRMSFMAQIRKDDLLICQVTRPKWQRGTPIKLVPA